MVKRNKGPVARASKYAFISYRRDDTEILARLLHHELERWIGGDRVFIDREDIDVGRDFVARIEETLASAGVVLVLIGRRWLTLLKKRLRMTPGGPDYHLEELRRALASSVPVVPILVDGAAMPATSDLPEDLAPLARQNALELTKRYLDPQVQEIIDVVRRCLALPAREEQSRSPRDRQLLAAAQKGNVARIRALLLEGAPVDIRDEKSRTPLMLAAEGGHSLAVTLLADEGADLGAVDEDGFNALILGVAGGTSPPVTKTLLDRGANANAQTNDGSTALLHAAHQGDPNLVALLLEHGADPNLGNKLAAFPMERALFIKDQRRKMEVLKLLTDAAAKRAR